MNHTPAPERDKDLGALLRRLPVPPHGPEFFAELEQAISEEEAAQGSLLRGSQDERRTRATAPATRPRRRPLRARRFVTRLLLPVAAALLLVLAGAWGFRSLSELGPVPASAAEVTARMSAALAEGRALGGKLVVRSRDASTGEWDEMRWRFLSTARGDFGLSGLTREEEFAYDAERGVERALSREEGESFAAERSGLAPGLPDPSPSDWVLQRRLGSLVRALLAGGATVSESEFEGRPVWVLATEAQQNMLTDLSGDHLEVTVDQETGFPLRVVESKAGEVLEETLLQDLEVDPEIRPDSFSLELPPEATRTEGPFVRVPLAQVEAEVGYSPLVPAQVPDGYELAEIAVAELSGPTGTEGMNPESRSVVSLAYRRGFDRLLVTTRLAGEDPGAWSDPLSSGEGFVDRAEAVEIAEGPFAGARAELLIATRTEPHLWAIGEKLVLTVSGDLTREELLIVAQSLEPAELPTD